MYLSIKQVYIKNLLSRFGARCLTIRRCFTAPARILLHLYDKTSPK